MTFTRSYSFVRKRALQLLRVVIDRDWRCINSLLSIVVINQHCYHCWECLNFGAEYYTKNWDWNVSHLMYVKLNFRGFEFSYIRLNSSQWIASSVWIAILDLKSIFSLVETNFTIFLTKKWLMRLPISLKRRQMSMNHYEMDCVLWLPTPNNWFIGENGLLQMGGSRLVPFVSLT